MQLFQKNAKKDDQSLQRIVLKAVLDTGPVPLVKNRKHQIIRIVEDINWRNMTEHLDDKHAPLMTAVLHDKAIRRLRVTTG